MMRLWLESYAKTSPISQSAVLSVVAHAALVSAAVVSTKRPADVPEGSIANRVYYLTPPDRVPGQQGTQETLKYVELAPPGPSAGAGRPSADAARKPTVAKPPELGNAGLDAANAPAVASIPSADSVLSVIDVDTAVTRYPGSAAPAYPVTMLHQGVQGSVATRYVVDTTGFADSSSLTILRTTHPDFADAVRAALPYMRFIPAKLGPRRVRQLVEQEFTFRIEQAAAVPGVAKKPES
jgi:protein TonB